MQNLSKPVCETKYKSLITILVMVTTFMQVLDSTITNVALPHMQGSLSATQDQISWVITSYIVSAAIMTLPTGWFSGKFGRKKFFLISIAGFTITSMLCGIANSLEEMVIFRLLQGIFGASLIPLSQSVLLDINPKESHGKAMAIWGMGVMIGPILGPTCGGYLTEYYNWRWIFYINLPAGILAFIGLFFFLPETKIEKQKFNLFSFINLAISIGALQLLLDRGEQKDWFSSMEIIIYGILCILSFWVFIFGYIYGDNKFFNPEIFKDRNLVLGLILIFFVGMILVSTVVLIPQYMQNIMGYSVLSTGLITAPRGGGTMLSMMIVAKIGKRIEGRTLIIMGFLILSISLYEMTTFSSFVPANIIIQNGIIQGMGIGFIFTPLSAITFSTLNPIYRTDGTALYSLMRNLGSSIGVSLVTALLQRNIQQNHSYLSENITAYTKEKVLSSVKNLNNGFTTDDINNIIGIEMINDLVNLQAATIAYINNFKFLFYIGLFGFCGTFLIYYKYIFNIKNEKP